MWFFKKKDKRFLEIWWEYPVPNGVPLKYSYRFTNKLQRPDVSCGNLGRGYESFDLHDEKQFNLTQRLNYGYKENNHNTPYISHEILVKCREIFNKNKRGE